MASSHPEYPRRSIWRRAERRFVGLWMSLIVWLVERRLLKSARRSPP